MLLVEILQDRRIDLRTPTATRVGAGIDPDSVVAMECLTPSNECN